MATEVPLPELGESVTEGVITAWLVNVGDTVTKDQPLVEVSTDKVDTEIPSPVAGVVTALNVNVDDTVQVGATLVTIDAEGSDTADASPAEDDQAAAEPDTATEDTEPAAAEPKTATEPEPAATTPAPAAPTKAAPPASAQPAPSDPQTDADSATGDGAGVLTSPLVRRMLRDAKIAVTTVTGSGLGGRITRTDAEQAIAKGGSQASATAATPFAMTVAPTAPSTTRPNASPNQIAFAGERSLTTDLSRVRKAIAKAMLHSMQTTAQLTSVVEVDMTRVMGLRTAAKDSFKAREGASLTPLSLTARAVCMVLPRHPVINAAIDTEAGTATFYNYVNLGIAVDTPNGLVVPNIKNAQDLTVAGIAKQVGSLASSARDRKLQPDDIAAGTFTITNTGSVGSLLDTPILNPPEVAILATCAIEKRPVVVSDAYGDAIAIRWMSYLCLSYDHRMVDGADAARFLNDLKYALENHDFSAELGV